MSRPARREDGSYDSTICGSVANRKSSVNPSRPVTHFSGGPGGIRPKHFAYFLNSSSGSTSIWPFTPFTLLNSASSAFKR